ncbi:MAG: hypothetical protein AB7N80_00725 [Bdellovibrionales bacterium]
MRVHKYIGLGAVLISASMIVACADQKGFRSRITTPEDVLKAKIANGQVKPQDADRGTQGDRAFHVPGREQSAAGGATAGSEQRVELNDESRGALSSFVSLTMDQQERLKVGGQQAGGAEGSTAGAASAAAKADEKAVAKLAEIAEVLKSGGGEVAGIVKGLDVKLVNRSAKEAKAGEGRFELALDLLLVGNKDVVASGKAELTGQDLLETPKIVEVKMNSIDLQARELELKGIEVYAACLKDTCEVAQVLILITRADQSKLAVMVQIGLDGKVKASSLGNQLRSVKDGQTLLGQERAQADAERAAEEAAREAELARGRDGRDQEVGRQEGGAAAADSSALVTPTEELSVLDARDGQLKAARRAEVAKQADAASAPVQRPQAAPLFSSLPRVVVAGRRLVKYERNGATRAVDVKRSKRIDQIEANRSREILALIKGIKLTRRDRTATNALVNVEITLNYGRGVVTGRAEEVLNPKEDFFKNNKFVEMDLGWRRGTSDSILSWMKAGDLRLQGIDDVQALVSCADQECKNLRLMVMLTRTDKKDKVSLIRDYKFDDKINGVAIN